MVDVLSDDGKRIQHRIPSRFDCRECHESNETPILGFSELQLNGAVLLSADDGPLASHELPERQLDHLAELGLLDDEPKDAETIEVADELTAQVLGYLVGNCAACHNGSDGPSSSFDLRPDVALDNLVEQPTASSATAAGIRVVPGEPTESILYQSISGDTDETEVKFMPPIGVQLRDTAAVDLIYEWIEELK